MVNEGICVVTVTYGKRSNLLSEVIRAIQNEEMVKKIIVVNNGSDLSQLEKTNFKIGIDIINLQENTGSANGYNIGYKEALKTDLEYIFTIDDDNLPVENCIKYLYQYYNLINKNRKKNVALLALREDRLDFNKVAKGDSVERSFSLGNSFLGWEFNKIPIKLWNKIISKVERSDKDKRQSVEYVKVPVAPYGGLFFHRTLLKSISLPNPEYYLYCDDYDFTYQISKGIGEIYLIPSCKIIDIDKSWFVKEKHGFIMSFLKSDSDFRIFYSVRNRVYFETRNLVKNRFIYFINKKSFLLLLFIFSIITNKLDRFKMIIRAIKNGDNGNLGKESSFS